MRKTRNAAPERPAGRTAGLAGTALTVRDPTAVALLMDARRNRFLQPFMGRACGVSEAADTLHVSRSLASYWVGRLCAAGLLAPVESAVPGSARNLAKQRHRAYRSVAPAFVVPLSDLPWLSEADVLSAHMDADIDRIKHSLLQVALQFCPQWEVRVESTPKGVLRSIAPRGGALHDAPLVNDRGFFTLSKAEAAQLRQELRALMQRYGALSQPGPRRQRHLVWMAAVEEMA